MFSVMSLLSGAALAGLIYGFSFLPSATLTRCDDIECTGEDRTLADKTDVTADGAQDTHKS